MDVDLESMATLQGRYACPYFRILVIGRANAGKTTILEKVCHVAQGTQTIIYDEHGVKMKNPKLTFKLPTSLKKVFRMKLVAPLTPHLKSTLEVSCMVELVDLHPLICNQSFLEGHT